MLRSRRFKNPWRAALGQREEETSMANSTAMGPKEVSMKVILNPWVDGEPLYPGCTCWSCGEAAPVVEFPHYLDCGLLARICGVCLHRAKDTLEATVLASTAEQKAK